MKSNNKFIFFCTNIRKLRKAYGMTQKEMAQQLHIGVDSLRKIEKGECPPRVHIDILVYAYRVFGFTPTELTTKELLLDTF